MLGDPLAVPRGERADHPRRLADAAQVGDRQQHPRVTPLPELIEAQQPGAQGWTGRGVLRLEDDDLAVERRQIAGDRRGGRIRLPELFAFDLTLELEPPEVAEQASLFGSEAVCLVVQRLKTLSGPAGERLGPRVVRLLGTDRAAGNGNRNGGCNFVRNGKLVASAHAYPCYGCRPTTHRTCDQRPHADAGAPPDHVDGSRRYSHRHGGPDHRWARG